MKNRRFLSFALYNTLESGPYFCHQSQQVSGSCLNTPGVFINFALCFFFFPPLILISWRLVTLQYCSGFCHTLTWISHGFTCVPHPDSPSCLPPHPSLWVFPVHQARALVSGIQPGLAIYFTLDSILVSMLFSLNIPPSPSPTDSKSLFCTSVSLFLFCI